MLSIHAFAARVPGLMNPSHCSSAIAFFWGGKPSNLCVCSPFGVIAKSHLPSAFGPILDLISTCTHVAAGISLSFLAAGEHGSFVDHEQYARVVGGFTIAPLVQEAEVLFESQIKTQVGFTFGVSGRVKEVWFECRRLIRRIAQFDAFAVVVRYVFYSEDRRIVWISAADVRWFLHLEVLETLFELERRNLGLFSKHL